MRRVLHRFAAGFGTLAGLGLPLAAAVMLLGPPWGFYLISIALAFLAYAIGCLWERP